MQPGVVMGHTIKLAALGAVAFLVLDGVWLADVAWGTVASAACAAVVRFVVR
jgi:uncharacterized membrane protein